MPLHYRRTGGSKPSLILLHALAANGECWNPLTHALREHFDVVTPDAKGHGNPSALPRGYRYEDHARDIVALIRQLDVHAPAVLGHSMGGMTAALVASRHAELVRSVVLVDPTFISPQRQRDVHDSGIVEQHRQLLLQDKATIVADLQARHPRRSIEILELLAEARLQTHASAFDILTPPNPDYRDVMCAITVPVLLVISDGGIVSPDSAREIQALNPRVHIEYIEGAGHGIPYDQPERLQAVVSAFLQNPREDA